MEKEITEEEYHELMRKKNYPQCVEDMFPCKSLNVHFKNNKSVSWSKEI